MDNSKENGLKILSLKEKNKEVNFGEKPCMNIEFSPSPNTADIEFLTQKINQETVSYGAAYPFAFFIRDDDSQIIAGANGSVIFGSIYTDQLWVHSEYRKQGLGAKLMEKVHDYGRENGCKIATVASMSFQEARKFYEKLGYEVDFERKGYVNNSSCFFFKKTL